MNNLTLRDYISYAWEHLWFLRPEWFYAFIPIVFILVLFIINNKHTALWKKLISKKLLPFLTVKGTKRQFILPKIGLLFILSFMAVALAGPTWEKIERPGQKTEAAMVVLMDLSRSMLVEDIQPNRIERAKLKMIDFFEAKPNAKTALIAYAGTAHNVVPFSKDYKTIIKQMVSLRPDIMPMQGSNLAEAMTMADTLLSNIVAPSTILIVTDNITADDVERIALSAVHSHIEILAIATPNGGTIPVRNNVLKDKKGNTVLPRLEVYNLNKVQEIENANVITVTLDDSDVKILAARVRQNLEFIIDLENAEEEWKDFGYWLLFPIMLISLFWFRRGWKVHWVLIPLILSSCNDVGEFSIEEQFFTKDQKAQLLYNKGEKEKAAATYESGDLIGYTYYELGNLEKALEGYSNDVSPKGFYNLGIIYAEMGDLEASQQAFSTSLELDPEFQLAKSNLGSITQTIDSIEVAKALAEGRSIEDSSNPTEFDDYTESLDEKEYAKKSEERYEGEGDIQEMETFEVDESTIDIFEFDATLVIDKDEAKQTLLRQVTEDPSLFLRRKFAYQNYKRKQTIKKMEEQW